MWGVVLDVKPTSAVAIDEQHFHALTVDADWLGQKADAPWLADLLGRNHTELSIPAVGDPTPSTAVLYLERNDKAMLMDYLAGVTGIQSAEWLKYAAEVDVAMPDGRTVPLRMLDPVQARLAAWPT